MHPHVSDAELAARRARWNAPAPRFERGYGWMFTRHIGPPQDGCDFDFLTDFGFGRGAGEPAIF